jgi:MoxR-like ATPase
MSYFKEIEEYRTYSGELADFHFNYNANSGGGQAFLGGKYYDANGDLVSPQILDGKKSVFKFTYVTASGEEVSVVLDDIKAKYDIKPRGHGSRSMKLSVGNDRTSPSKVISAFMMLPPTCGVKTPTNLDVSILSSHNYWLQSMWLKCNTDEEQPNEVKLIPVDLVFGGGTSKDTSERQCRYFCLDVNKRMLDIISLSNTENLFSAEISQTLKLFSDIYQGNATFQYDECSVAINRLMIELAIEYPACYSGITDPLPVLIDIATNQKLADESTKSSYATSFARNRILFGAPGTGKSYTLNKDRKVLLGEENETDYERVTFHPDYSYAQFVGTYKPVPSKDENGHDSITYEYVPGPFMRIYVEAVKSSISGSPKPYLLIIEEINRANAAAVFGDVFQLLDRDSNISEYPIMPSKDMKDYLAKPDVLGGSPEDYAFIKIPDNMFIWATMNSADQGVFPMDTAFKRRWNFTYFGINDAEEDIDEEIQAKTYTFGAGDYARVLTWNQIRKAINEELSSEAYNINEDKLLGFYFISKSTLLGSESDFMTVFKNKVLMYLFDDAVKQKRKTFFDNCKGESKGVRYSEICTAFDKLGVFIFPDSVSSEFKVRPTTTEMVAGAE